MSDRACRVARRLVEDVDLTPPVPIFDVLAEHAEVHWVLDMPSDMDGLALSPHPGQDRYRVYLLGPRSRRQAFTAAHELGHIKMLWHTNVVCTTNDWQARRLEQEAHIFASEVMAPQRWIDQRRSLWADQPVQMLRDLASTGLSLHAQMMVTRRWQPPNVIFVRTRAGVVQDVWENGHYRLRPPIGNRFNRDRLQAAAEEFGTVEVGWNWQIHWYRLAGAPEARPITEAAADHGAALKRILEEVGLTENDQARVIRQMAGLLSKLTQRSMPRQEAMDTAWITTNRDGLEAVRAHPDFPAYLALRVDELQRRARAKGR